MDVLGATGPLVDITYRHFMLVGLGSPAFGLAFCLLYSIAYNYESVNTTHCKVPNVIPSISSCIGQHSPQIYVWRTCVALMITQRALDVIAYHRFYGKPWVLRNMGLRTLNWANTALMALEYTGLVLLTYVSTTENHDIHVYGFTLFITAAMLHMVSSCILFSKSRLKGTEWTAKDRFSFRWKRNAAMACYGVFGTALYFYWRHNTYCEPYLYSMFCSCEWATVFINIVFHFSAWVDFAPCSLLLASADDHQYAKLV